MSGILAFALLVCLGVAACAPVNYQSPQNARSEPIHGEPGGGGGGAGGM